MGQKIYFLLLLLLVSCEGKPISIDSKVKAERICRRSDQYQIALAPPEKRKRELYPWESPSSHNLPVITKEYFRCKGSSLNPVRLVSENGNTVRYYDCGGGEKHSLPLRDGKEFIYPILIDLLNYIQERTGSKVVITCGHRCPEHNVYSDPSPASQYSKHMIGGEVSFYVQGMEERPEEVVAMIKSYYEQPRYKDKGEYEFLRYDKDDVQLATRPWFNKELFVKLFTKKEGRNVDNRHPYSYISVQVRYDEDLKQRVNYAWDKAHNNYHRW